jgi:lipopolysaccharide transport system permease protein
MTASELMPTALPKRSMVVTILTDIWSSRELLHQLVQRDIRLRYRQAAMGFAWAIFMPILTIGAGLIMRSFVASAGAGANVPSIGGIAIKSWAWAFFAGAMNFATMSLIANIGLVTKIYFPREVLPLAAIATQCVDSAIGLAVILAAGPWLGFHWSLALFAVPLLVALLIIFTTGLAFLFACANLFMRDVKYILQVLLMFGIFFTPVFYEPSMASPRVARLLMLNPLSPILEGLRLTMVDRESIFHAVYRGSVLVWSPWHLAYSAAVGVVCFVVGGAAFRRSAAMFSEYY